MLKENNSEFITWDRRIPDIAFEEIEKKIMLRDDINLNKKKETLQEVRSLLSDGTFVENQKPAWDSALKIRTGGHSEKAKEAEEEIAKNFVEIIKEELQKKNIEI